MKKDYKCRGADHTVTSEYFAGVSVIEEGKKADAHCVDSTSNQSSKRPEVSPFLVAGKKSESTTRQPSVLVAGEKSESTARERQKVTALDLWPTKDWLFADLLMKETIPNLCVMARDYGVPNADRLATENNWKDLIEGILDARDL